ncbi:E3 ubiquitin-protein ligase bre1 [Knufia fluminis]|uniref:E3 ubiquitin protein ligase n=1 Tax=Knufia fluminis TaxID=191047 RepID=A0AAN8EGX4_9EURO|nr:E3 ubiquitin-protein ligase bre1 [Knufia fluminis]
MEDRKRPLNDHHDSTHPSKKQATSANGAGKGHRDDDMPWKDDLEKVQKDALLRQVGEYKRAVKDLESQLAERRKKARDHDDHLRTIDAWLRQFIDEVKLLMPEEEDSMDVDSAPSALQFTDQKDFEQHLQSHAASIQSLVQRLSTRSKDFTPDVAELHSKFTKLLATEKEHLAELEKLRAETSDLDERLQNASLRYMVAEKKLDRARSVTAAKLDKGILMGGTTSAKDDSTAVKREDSQVNGVSDHSEDVEKLEAEVNKTAAINEKQQEQIAKLEEENAQLSSKVTELTTKSSMFTDEDYSKTELYKQLKIQHDDAVKKLNDLEASSTQLRDENGKFQSERTKVQEQLENESRSAISEKDTTLAQTQTDLARVRNHRDELMADQAVKKASLDERAESLKKLKELSSAHEDRIKALESENERLTTQAGNLMAVSSELDSMSADELRSKFQELEKKYSMMNGELQSMSSAYQKTQRLASQKVADYSVLEEKTTKLSAEKAKADQKYFAAMKSKETRDMEVRTLRMQTTKSSELVSQLKEAEAASRSLLTNLEKQLAEVKSALTTKTNEQQSASRQSTTQASEIARLNAQVTDLKNTLSTKDAKLSSTSSACRSAEVEAEGLKTSLADTRKSLEAWKSKGAQSEEHELLRQFAYCTVCRKELKNTVIKTCGHTFCHNCVDKVIQLRSRKCPNCGKPFGSNDHQRIIL